MTLGLVVLCSILVVVMGAGVLARHPLFRGLAALLILVLTFVFSLVADGATARAQRNMRDRSATATACEEVWFSAEKAARQRLDFVERVLLAGAVCLAVMVVAPRRRPDRE